MRYTLIISFYLVSIAFSHVNNWHVKLKDFKNISCISLIKVSDDSLFVMDKIATTGINVDSIVAIQFTKKKTFSSGASTGLLIGAPIGIVIGAISAKKGEGQFFNFDNPVVYKTAGALAGGLIMGTFGAIVGGVSSYSDVDYRFDFLNRQYYEKINLLEKLVNLEPGWHKHQSIVNPDQISDEMKMYFSFYQTLLDELRTRNYATSDKIAHVSRYHKFNSSYKGVYYIHSFIKNDKMKIEIYFDGSVFGEDHALFEDLYKIRNQIEIEFGSPLSWETYNSNSRGIALYRDGSILYKDSKYIEIKEWSLNNLIKFKEFFNTYLKKLR